MPIVSMSLRLAAVTACLAFPGSPGHAQQAFAGDAGHALIERHCARCHAVGSTGESPHPDAPPFRTLSRRYPVSQLSEALVEGLLTGHPDMPEFVFSPTEAASIIAYLQSIQE
ncbi:cytochrome c [Aurantimonas sp. VKM B-3413]|uniref:c-type cytochrome n=1 Tax=Aurantimonas sp. VKM B-3413 TaxID=2779401 RepID=UPI001E59596D|nr:cytochrome c [Aurantimonas sp. VKM B-3413]MCB8836433.1 cytochrome c [Aurantimonas sp. VKM B-3413]